MANFNANATKQKAMAVARTVSKKSGSTIGWINLTEQFSKSVFGVEVKNITAKQMEEVLPELYGNQYMEVVVTDLTAELAPISAIEY